MKKEFIDTNIVVYANDAADPRKQDRAIELIRRLIETGNGVVSSQVLVEYTAVATGKLGQPHEAVTRQLFNLERLEVVLVNGTLIIKRKPPASPVRLEKAMPCKA